MAVFKLLFTVIGAILLFAAFTLFMNKRDFIKTAVKTQGQVIYAGKRAVIAFSDSNNNRVEYTSSVECDSPCYDLYEKVDLYYNKDNPYDVMVSDFTNQYLPVLALSFFGLILFLTGIEMIVVSIRRNIKDKSLKKNGIEIETNFVGVVANTSIKVLGKSPTNIITNWVDENNLVHEFKSLDFWGELKEGTDKNTKVIVYIDKNDISKYYVETSSLDSKS